MEKLLAQSKGSVRDPDFRNQGVMFEGEEVPFLEYFHRHGIKTLREDKVNSVHGNTEHTLELASDIYRLARKVHRIVAIQAGGLYFGKPSVEAANMPVVPVISIPLDGGTYGGLDAFLAPQVPSGTAAIAGAGIGQYQAGAHVAKEILCNTFSGVYTYKASDTLKKKLDSLGIPILDGARSSEDRMYVGCLPIQPEEMQHFNSLGAFGVYTPLKNTDPAAVVEFMRYCADMNRSVWVRGDENVAFFVAKIFASHNPSVYRKLIAHANEKAKSYDSSRVTLESFVGGR